LIAFEGHFAGAARAAEALTPRARHRRLAMFSLASAACVFARASFFAMPR
jgi:hypothetical protein